MFLEQFHSSNNNIVSISAEQGSSFAKDISNDFNPIHDPDSKRFCVPGDLLFALVLGRYGISEKMSFNFAGMVSAETELLFPKLPVSILRFWMAVKSLIWKSHAVDRYCKMHLLSRA